MDYKTNNKALTLLLPIQANEDVRVVVYDKFKANTIYSDRTSKIKGKENFIIRLPQSPRFASIRVISKSGRHRVLEPKEVPLKTKVSAFNYKDPVIISFVTFAQEFAENAAILDANDAVYRSDDGVVCVKYVNAIKNPKTGEEMNTPARIGVQTGTAEISKSKFLAYNVQGRVAILLHEFSHFYLNKNIKNEVEADKNALRILLGLGYSKTEIASIFLKVLHNSENRENKKRYLILEDFLKNFEKHTFSGYYYNNNEKK